MSTYHVAGTLFKENFETHVDTDSQYFDYFSVNQVIEAGSAKAAKDHFEENGWEWDAPPRVQLITEAMKMEKAGQPTLFERSNDE